MASSALDFLRDRIAEAIGGRRKAMAFVADRAPSFTRKTLQSWIDGKTWPDAAELVELAGLTGRDLLWFLGPSQASTPPERDDLVLIPRLDVEVAAGEGRIVDVVTSIAELPFPREFVERMAPRGADLQCLQVRGDSMAPTIQDGALIVIDRKQADLPPWRSPPRKAARPPQRKDAIYVFNHSGQLRLKRLRDLGENFVAIVSDNADAHPPEIIRQGRDGGLRIIGKVVWWDVRA